MSEKNCPHNYISKNGEVCPECKKPQEPPDVTESEKDQISPESDSNTIKNEDVLEEVNPISIETKTENSKIGNQDIDQAGRDIIKHYHGDVSKTDNDGEPQNISLYAKSEPYVVKTSENSDIDIKHLVEDLKTKRIFLLGDPGDNSVLNIANQIISSFNGNYKEENTRLLRIDDFKQKSLKISSLSFDRDKSEKKEQESIVIVDSIDEGRGFADSLLNPKNISDSEYYPSKLRKNNLYMLCLFRAKAIASWTNRNNSRLYSYKIFDEKPKIQFDEDIGEVRAKVKKGFATNKLTDFLIIRVIWFVASFFPNLTTNNFNELVGYWLKTESVPLNEIPTDNAAENPNSKEIDIYNIWEFRDQHFSKLCYLTQNIDDNGKRTIGFRNELYRETIKETFQKSHWAFVEKKVSEIMKMLLIFHISEDIAEQSRLIQLEYLPGNEENFKHHILAVLDGWKENKSKNENTNHWEEGEDIGIFGDKEEINDIYHCYRRLGQLFREMLDVSSLDKSVTSILNKLIQNKNSQSALRIVKRLMDAPGFDEIKWFKQIYNRGNSEAKLEIRKYYFRKIKNSDFEETCEKLRDWIPDEEKPFNKYSESDKMPFNLLAEYYSYLTDKYDEKLYGIEPTQFTLFEFKNKRSAEKQIDKIIRYLLHSVNLKLDLKDISYEVLVAMLLEIWNKILCTDNFSKPKDSEKTLSIKNSEILNIILEKIISYSEKDFQETIKDYLKTGSKFCHMAGNMSDDWETSDDYLNNHELIELLIEDFTEKQWAINQESDVI